MTTLDYLVQIETPKLTVPGELRPTWSGRGWLIEPFGTNPWYSALAASIPALLATILLFMDQQITAVIVNRKEHKLCVRNICCICITLVVSSEMELHIAHCTFIVAAKFAFDVLKDIHTLEEKSIFCPKIQPQNDEKLVKVCLRKQGKSHFNLTLKSDKNSYSDPSSI